MIALDIRTILIGFVFSDIICACVIGALWAQHRQENHGLGLWAFGVAFGAISISLLAMRGLVPDLLSIVGGNVLNIAGFILLLTGLRNYLDMGKTQIPNWIMIAVFASIQTYFAVVAPNLAVRYINISVAIFIVSAQCAWLLLYRAAPQIKKLALFSGIVFALYSILSVIRILGSFSIKPDDNYLNAGTFDALILLAYQMLFIALTLSLFQMVNRRLAFDLAEVIANRDKAQATLRLSEAGLKEAQAIAHIGDWSMNPNTRAFIWSEEVYKIHGVPPSAEIPHDSYIEFIHPDDRKRVLAEMRAAMAGLKKEFIIDYRVVRPDGEERYIALMGKAVPNESGTLETIRGTMQDITARRETEKALIESEMKFRSMFENMSAASCLDELIYENGKAVDYRVIDINPAFEQITGMTKKDAIGKRASALYCDEKIREIPFFETFVEVAETGKPISFEAYFPPIKKYLQVTSSSPSKGRFSTVFTDITERMELQKQVEYLASFPTMNSNPVIEIGRDGTVRYANAAALDALTRLGLDPDARQFLPDEPDELARLIARCGQGILRREVSLGEATFLMDLNAPNDKALRIYAVDITARVRLMEEIKTLNDELELRIQRRTADLEASNKELEAFSYSVSHDLRAPLRGIDGFSHAFLEDYGRLIPVEGQAYLDRIRSATKRMGGLIDDLLRLSQIARTPLYIEEVNLSALAEEVLQEFMRYDTKRIVKWSVAPGMMIAGDINLLRIALTNLIGNAWKFTSKRDEAHIEIGTTNDPDRGRAFFVRDNGAGFDPTYADKLFVAFQRLHTQQEYPGMGIGLATVLRAVRRHGGTVWAKSEPDSGATFYFTIPAIQTSIHRKEEQA